MPIKLTCPNCRRSLTLPRSDAGKPALCNACGQRIQIPLLPLSTQDLAKLEAPPEPIPNPGLSNPPSDFSQESSISINADSLHSPRSQAGLWTAAGIVALFAASLIGLAVRVHLSPDWETANRAVILQTLNEADMAIVAGDLQTAARKYQEAEAFVSDHMIGDPKLRAAVEGGSIQKRKILALLVDQTRSSPVVESVAIENETRQNTPPADVSPSVAVSQPSPSTSSAPTISHPATSQSTSFLHVVKQVPAPEPVNDERIGVAIQNGADWLFRRFDPKTHQLIVAPGRPQAGGVHGGLDALCVYALAQCGMAIHDDRFDIHKDSLKDMLTALDNLPIEQHITTYGHGIRATALALHLRKEDRMALLRDVKLLIKNQKGGAYDYTDANVSGRWDNSNSQYGLLGVWAGAESGIEVPTKYWISVQKHWVDCQTKEGGWGYTVGSPTLSMTLAGVASLFVCHDNLELAQFTGDVGRPPFSPALATGLGWLEQGDIILGNGDNWGYTLYGVERVGLASGFKFFGKHDWFRERAREALERQQPDGSWGNNELDTAYALLFLARGRHPILMNKLRFDGYWANRPRDVANLARFATKELERPLNFQVVSIERDWTDWTDSPILYLASHVAPKLTVDQIDNIRKFIEAGGLLYTQADGATPAFNQFATELAKKLFPQYPMTAVPKDHLVYSILYKIAPAPPLKMVSNGIRTLMIHSPQDLSMAWQGRMEQTRAPAFQFGVNLFLYAAGKGDLRNRVASNAIANPPAVTGGKIQVAFLRYAGDWNPEPAAWPRFARWFQQETSCGIEEKMIELDALAPKAASLAHLTGVAAFDVTPAQITAVQKFVDAGGTLLIDSAAGNAAFSGSAMQLLSKAFPDTSLKRLPAAHPLLTATFPGMDALATLPALRSYTVIHLGKDVGAIESFSHGKGHVLYTSLDMTSGLLGTHTWGILGYNPAYAQSLLKNTLLWIAAGAPDKAP